MGRIEFHPRITAFLRVYGSGLLKLAVTDLCRDPDGLGQGREGEPVEILRPQGRGEKLLLGVIRDL